MAEYSPRRASRWARASSGFASASRMGLSYSSTQHRHPLPATLVQRFEQVAEAFRAGGVRRADARAPFHGVQLRRQIHVEMAGLGEVPSAEVEPHDGVAHRPVPTVVDGETPRTADRCPRTAPSRCPRTGSCRNAAGGTGSSACLRPPDGRRRPSCRRSSSLPRGSPGKSGCRWAACASSWAHHIPGPVRGQNRRFTPPNPPRFPPKKACGPSDPRAHTRLRGARLEPRLHLQAPAISARAGSRAGRPLQRIPPVRCRSGRVDRSAGSEDDRPRGGKRRGAV